MHGLTVVCMCVSVCVCGWVVRSTCLQGGAVYITSSGISGSSGTFTNCNFTSNEASVSLEGEHADKSETYMILTYLEHAISCRSLVEGCMLAVVAPK